MPTRKPRLTIIQRERDHRAMMLSPDNWPSWPFLPLKRPNQVAGIPDVGLLYANIQGTTLEFYEGANLFEGVRIDQQHRLVDVDVLLKEGWIVD